ncbi:MAG: helicase HerA-like domain-containing protein, partial [Myxococcota bacterium]
MSILLGSALEPNSSPAQVRVPERALLRHVMALGTSGSGKTVLCKAVVEEAVLAGIPVICVDPQGDLASLAMPAEERDEPAADSAGEDAAEPPAVATAQPAVASARSAVDSERARAFAERADVVVFTPASRRGVPLCADPLGEAGLLAARSKPAADDDEDLMAARSRAAATLVALLGYDIDSDDGAGLRAVIECALGDLAAAGRPALRLGDLAALFSDMDADALARYQRYIDARKIRTAAQRLARLDVGARRRLFHDGLPIDIDMLLGRDRAPGAAPAGTTRVSVIYLNTLHDQADKEFFIAALVDRMYGWMLRHPSSEPQALFYIDEVAPFVPPVRKPSCKPGLELLFKQARKYGVCCLMATQNPGDVDYKAMAQFGTWALGRLTTRQDLRKIEPIVKSLAPGASDAVMAALPARRPGQFTVLSPDHFEQPRAVQGRWLYSAHRTLDEDQVQALADERWRQRFAVVSIDELR